MATISVTDDTFEELVLKSDKPVVVDFWAQWCGPCKMAAPEFANAASQLAGKAVLLKVNTESETQLAAQFGVRSIPNFKLFIGGEVKWDQAGALSSGQIVQLVEQFR